jgi:hypothetical protein
MISFRKKNAIILISLLSFFIFTAVTIAAATGTIDPNNVGFHYAAFVHAPTAQAGSAEINFGKFTTATSDNITISSGALHGYAWSPVAGWIVMNCDNTVSGCTSTNQNFKVAVSNTGVLSGYAWGQQTGWINFGPFVNNTTPQVQIGSNGNFVGTTGTAGYAWSETYGWIVFDCTNTTTCVSTDYTAAPSPTVTNTGTLSGGSSFSPSTAPTTASTSPASNPTAQTPGNTAPGGIPSSPGQASSQINSTGQLSLEPSGAPSSFSPVNGPHFIQIPPPQTPPVLPTPLSKRITQSISSTAAQAIHDHGTAVSLLIVILIFIVLLRFL